LIAAAALRVHPRSGVSLFQAWRLHGSVTLRPFRKRRYNVHELHDGSLQCNSSADQPKQRTRHRVKAAGWFGRQRY